MKKSYSALDIKYNINLPEIVPQSDEKGAATLTPGRNKERI